MQNVTRHHRTWPPAVLIGLLAASLATAFAASEIRVDAVADLAFEDKNDKPVKEMGIRFAIDGGLQLVVTDKGMGRIGDVVVPAFDADALPKNALDDVDLHGAIRSIGVVRAYPGGIVFVLEETHVARAVATLVRQLAAAGAQVGDLDASGRGFAFSAGGVGYRAVLGASASGTLVYLGD